MPSPPSSPSSSSQTQHPADHDASDGTAERRLREAEQRLKEAIEELQRRQQRHAAARVSQSPPCDHPDDSCIAHAIGNLCQSFLLSYGVRVGIGILLRAFKLARGQSYSSLLDLKDVCGVYTMHMHIVTGQVPGEFNNVPGSSGMLWKWNTLGRKGSICRSIHKGNVGYLASLERDERPMGVLPATLPGR